MTSCSYSVQSNGGYYSYGGYSVTIDSVVASHTASSRDASSNPGPNTTASDTHKFFNEKIALAFTTGKKWRRIWSSYRFRYHEVYFRFMN